MNNSLDLSSLREELEKQKKERERLITENALAEVKHKAALEEGEGEQSPSSEEAQAVSVNAVPDDVLMNGGSSNKAILWRCARDFFQPNIKLIKQYQFPHVVIEESKDCYVIYSSDIELAVSTLYAHFEFEIADFGICKVESDNQDYVEEIIYQGILRGFSIFPSLLEHEKVEQQKSTLLALKRVKQEREEESGIMKESINSFIMDWLYKSEKGLRLST
ncbi:hypothetical protein N8S19_22360 [Enterobacter hormaechei subsp. steigerwaltii]|nr:hypothetical protein [Enterobacter hormaechei subsp. xiangfangensis]MCU2775049.1 hypothetical protein [Enterobacter hormaechei subsp. steigerwaltii]HDL6713784.1 hypothetical protein [Yersinia enterocolitica]MCU2754115.1 hypothetical protein [Enterobacter hormaechei subsp. xiangfangensis]MCU2998598.1 hypothetical protein [Enterobacter hormaechei subsp. xiangfangensis]